MMKKLFWTLCLLLFTVTAYAQNHAKLPFPTGKIVPKVICEADPTQSYALYVPSSYVPRKKCPVIYGFDPGARGRIPVKLLKAAAEKYGYIVVGSNNSRNGPGGPILKAQTAMWKDVNARFSIEAARSYAVGFSGGARVALRMAMSNPGRFAGVISCGAFFVNGPPLKSDAQIAVFGIAGKTCFNHPELLRADKYLAKKKIAHWVEIFPGGHQWPPKPYMTEAVEFMQVIAMRMGQIPTDKSFIAQVVKQRLKSAAALEKPGNMALALRKYSQIADFFKGVEGAKAAAAKTTALKDDPEIKKQVALKAKFNQYYADLRDVSKREQFRKIVDKLHGIAKSNDKVSSGYANTILRAVYIKLTKEGFAATKQKDYEQVAKRFSLAGYIHKKNLFLPYNAACAYSMLNNKEKAIDQLSEAVRRGFTDAAKIKEDPDFENIRKEPEYLKILESLKAND